MTDKAIEYNVSPQFLVLDKNFKGAGARLSASKDLDKSSKIQAYADVMAGSPKGMDSFVKPQKIGIEYRKTFAKGGKTYGPQVKFDIPEQIEKAIESLADPITGSPSHGKLMSGIICIHVDDLFCVGDKEFYNHVVSAIQKGLSNWFTIHK